MVGCHQGQHVAQFAPIGRRLQAQPFGEQHASTTSRRLLSHGRGGDEMPAY
jgi:hypothetical protein